MRKGLFQTRVFERTMMKRFHAKMWVAPVAVSALLLAGCATGGSDTDGGGENAATGDPIQVAALSSMLYFPEAPEAAQAVFDEYNANGGFNGQPIEYQVFDDKGDPAASTTAARDALSSGAVALVGSSSMLDCAINHKSWAENNIVSIQGTGVDPYCFSTPNIAAMNTGPYFGTFASLSNGSENYDFKKTCAFIVPDDAAGASAYQQAIDAWSAETGNELALIDTSLVRGQASYAGNVAQITTEKCDSIFINEVAPAVTSFLSEATNQGISLPVLALTPTYSQEFVDTLNYSGDIYLPAEFSPWSDPEDPSNDEWLALMEENGIGITSFAQGGYLAAKAFIAILETTDGDLTRESFTEAAKAMTDPMDTNGMIGTPWFFGPGDSHQPNAAGWPLIIKANSGEFTSVGPWFIGTDNGWVNTTVPNS